MTSFSVLICTYNRPDLLQISLSALIDKTIEKPDQVVVVNGGDERSDSIVQFFMDRPGITVELIKTVNVNLATSRNIGLVRCSGDFVAMTDDDAEVFPDWVTEMKRIHEEHPEAGAVGGAVLGADSDKSLLSRIADVATFSSPPEASYVRTLPGVNVSYKRLVLQKVGLQDETLFRGEDVDFNWRVKLLGYEIYYTPEIKVIHHHRQTVKGFINQFYMYGRAYYLVRSKWPEMYCVYPLKITRFHDLLKILYFFVSSLFEPAQILTKLSAFKDKLFSLPIVYLLHLSWKIGVFQQALISKQETEC
jgi:GT2 family glycosyltransferase